MQSIQLQRAGADPGTWSPSSRQYSPMPLPGQKPFGWVGGEGSYLKTPQQSQNFRVSDFINGPTGQQFNQAINDVALNGSQALQNNVNNALGKIGNQNLRNFTQGLSDYGFNFANNFVRNGGIQQTWSGLQKGPQYQANYNDIQRGPPPPSNFNDIQQGGQQVQKKKKQGFFSRLWSGIKNFGSKIFPTAGKIIGMIPHPAAQAIGAGMNVGGNILGMFNK